MGEVAALTTRGDCSVRAWGDIAVSLSPAILTLWCDCRRSTRSSSLRHVHSLLQPHQPHWSKTQPAVDSCSPRAAGKQSWHFSFPVAANDPDTRPNAPPACTQYVLYIGQHSYIQIYIPNLTRTSPIATYSGIKPHIHTQGSSPFNTKAQQLSCIFMERESGPTPQNINQGCGAADLSISLFGKWVKLRKTHKNPKFQTQYAVGYDVKTSFFRFAL